MIKRYERTANFFIVTAGGTGSKSIRRLASRFLENRKKLMRTRTPLKISSASLGKKQEDRILFFSFFASRDKND